MICILPPPSYFCKLEFQISWLLHPFFPEEKIHRQLSIGNDKEMGRDNLPLWKWKWEKNTYTSWSCPSVWPNSTIWSSYVGSHGKRRTGSFDKNLSDVKYLIAFTTIEDIASRGEKHIYQVNLKRPRGIWFTSYLASCTGNTATLTWLKQTIYCPSEVCYCLLVLTCGHYCFLL